MATFAGFVNIRITSQSHLYNSLQYLRSSQEALAAAEAEAVSGKRVATVSDDPAAAGALMRIDQQLRATEQFRRNGAAVRTRLVVEDEVSTTLRDLVEQARGLALQTLSDSPTDPTRESALNHVRSLIDQAIALGNTRVGNDYIFAGGETDVPPFLADGTYVGDTNVRQVEIQKSVQIDTNHTGDQLFASSIQALQDLAFELEFGTGASIQGTVPALGAADRDVLANQAELGLRQQELDWTDSHLARRTETMLSQRENIAQANPEEAIVRFMAAQTALDQAREMISRIIQTSLVDHL